MQNSTYIDVITLATYIFFVYLLLGTIVERLSEVVVAVYKYLELKLGWRDHWNKKAQQYQRRLDNLYRLQAEGTGKSLQTFSWLLWNVVTEPQYPGGRERVSARLIRQNAIQIGTRILAVVAALILIFALQVDIFSMIVQSLPGVELGNIFVAQPWLGKVLSAVAISIGTEPLHHVITRVERWSEKRAAGEKEGK
ncbi:MAG TPA: hypothetical protein VKA68_05795 [bacterium]|nr:hypothetical protein [bacterium]